MAFKVTIADVSDGQARVHEARSITGARRHAANAMIDRAVLSLADKDMFAAERTRRTQLANTVDCISAVRELIAWDGPTELSIHGITVKIDEDPEAHADRERAKTARRTDARWLNETRFPNPCVSCQCTVDKGERAWYQPKRGVWHAKCAPPEAADASRP